MSTIGRLFGRSPFGQIQSHMEQVSKCINKMAESIEAMTAGRHEELEAFAYEVSRMEHQADQIKDDIRNHLLRSFFMPIDRGDVMEILSLQDSLADTAEDVCKVMTMKKLPFPDGVREEFESFVELNLKAFKGVASIISDLDELIESGFGGAEAERFDPWLTTSRLQNTKQIWFWRSCSRTSTPQIQKCRLVNFISGCD